MKVSSRIRACGAMLARACLHLSRYFDFRILPSPKVIPTRSGTCSPVINTTNRAAPFHLSRAIRSNPTPFNLPGDAKGFGAALTYNFDSHWGVEVDFGYSRDTGILHHRSGPSAADRALCGALIPSNFSCTRLPASTAKLRDAGLRTHNGIGADPRRRTWIFRSPRCSPGGYLRRTTFGSRIIIAGLSRVPSFLTLRRPTSKALACAPALCSIGAARRLLLLLQLARFSRPKSWSASRSLRRSRPATSIPNTLSLTAGAATAAQVTGKDTTATIDTTNAAPGSYTVTAHVTDPKAKKANEASCSANYTMKPLPPKNPPTMSFSATRPTGSGRNGQSVGELHQP